MKKTKFFSEDSIDKLQRNVNSWLSKNKVIGIIRTDMQVATAVSKTSYCFYILYETTAMSAELALSEQMENVMPASEILPDVRPEDIITPDKDVYNLLQ